ncbi:MAG: thioredoxin family protein [Caulobacterales bacterium]
MTLFNRRNLIIGAGVMGAAAVSASYLLNSRAAEASVSNGARAPAFSARDASGATRTLSEFAGRTVILEWTNNGCPYVRKHYDGGNMQSTMRDAIAGGAVWLSVISSAPGEQGYADGAQALSIARAANASPTAILLDPAGTVGHAYGARTTPHMFIVNPQGAIVYQGAIDDRPRAAASSLEGATNYVRAALADLNAGRAVSTAQTTPYGCSVKYAS